MNQLSQEQLLHFKTTLRNRSQQLRTEIRDTLERSTEETHARVAEQARDLEDDSFSNLVVDLNLSEIDSDVDELRRIDSSLKRAADGRYGICDDCGVNIPQPRLDAEPTALRCIRCQERFEKTHAGTNAPTL